MAMRYHRRWLLLGLAATVGGAGCSRNRGGGWFRRQPPDTLEPKDGYASVARDNRPLIRDITAMRVEPTPGGIIVQATGLASAPGYWDPDLVRVEGPEAESSTLRLEFRVRPPITPATTAADRQSLREVQAGTYIPNVELDGIRTITVAGGNTSRSSRR